MKQEYIEKFKDKEWRMRNIHQIKNKDEKLIVFKKNRAQEHFDKHKHTRNIILKSRQLGFTTFEAVDALDDCMSKPNFSTLFISYDKESATDIFDEKVILDWDNLPPEIARMYSVDTKRANTLKISFGNNKYSIFRTRNKGRSGTYNRIHISEFGKICRIFPAKAEEIMSGTIPALPIDGRIDIESTAEGEIGYFHDMFWEAWDRGEPRYPQEFKAHFYNWTWDDAEINKVQEIIPTSEMDQGELFAEYQDLHKLNEREITYYYLKWLSLGKKWKLLQQEYPTTPEEAFISSGHKLFDKDVVAKMLKASEEGKKLGNWTYYSEYIPGHTYGLGADVAQGIGRDSSAITIWDFTPLKPRVVAIYKDNTINPDHFAHVIKGASLEYGSCIMAVENNNSMGGACILRLKDIANSDLIFTARKYGKKTGETDTGMLGWNTNSATKPKMFFDFNNAFSNELIDIPSRELLHECRTYDQEGVTKTRFDENQTNHWDLLTSAVIGYQMQKYALDTKKDYTGHVAGGVEPYYNEY